MVFSDVIQSKIHTFEKNNQVTMKSIKFSDKELDFVRKQYQFELAEAENYVQDIKNLLLKLGKVKSLPITAEKPEPVSMKAVRKPKVSGKKEPVSTKPKPVSITEKDKPTLEKKVLSKPKTKKKRSKRRGVILQSLRKPLPMKDITSTSPESEKSE